MSAYRTEIETAAAAHGLDPDLVEAVVAQESRGRADAFRHEPAFWTKYLANNPAYKDRNPREVSSSYGLMQIMFPTSVDLGFTGQPWELFAPAVSLEYGCRLLEANTRWASRLYVGLESGRAGAVTRSALAAYNGGKGRNAPTAGTLRNGAYADEVLARYREIQARA